MPKAMQELIQKAGLDESACHEEKIVEEWEHLLKSIQQALYDAMWHSQLPFFL